MDLDDVCVLLPTMNEAATVGEVVEGFREQGFDNVLVIDGGSTDDTQTKARAAGARDQVHHRDRQQPAQKRRQRHREGAAEKRRQKAEVKKRRPGPAARAAGAAATRCGRPPSRALRPAPAGFPARGLRPPASPPRCRAPPPRRPTPARGRRGEAPAGKNVSSEGRR
ncbi:MAG: hypothetical protein BRD29_04010 [Bacteroidetes bacterium QH_2_67_10]|nr:MAG: hypothetical protein BRD29_04010 [Bacteroidetes bacterium QH_2_67_10]